MIKQSKSRGINSIGHIGLLHRLTNSPHPTPFYFFTKNSETVTIGSGCYPDSVFPGMGVVNVMSEIALRLTLDKGQLSVVSLTRSDTSSRLIRADQSEVLLAKDQTHEIFRGDSITIGRLSHKRGYIVSHRILLHRAPLEKPPTPAPNTDMQPPAAAKSKKRAYPESRGSQDLRKAKRLRDRCIKAASKLHSGKSMALKERKSAKELLSQTGRKACPFEQQYSHCSKPRCPFSHQNKTRGHKYNNGDIATAIVRMWKWTKERNEGFGFAKTSDGVEFFMHSSKLKFDGRDLIQGATVKFEVRMNEKQGKHDEAINVILN